MTKEATTTKTMRRRFEGEVVKDTADKTISVKVSTTKMHPKYRKQYVSTKKYLVHDEKGRAHVGDWVVFEECRPLSKSKRWTLVKVVSSD